MPTTEEHGTFSPTKPDDLWAGAVVLFFLVTYFVLAAFALWFVFTHL